MDAPFGEKWKQLQQDKSLTFIPTSLEESSNLVGMAQRTALTESQCYSRHLSTCPPKEVSLGILMERVSRLASEKGVVIFSKTTCCLSYAVNILFQELFVCPEIYEIDRDPEGREMEKALMSLGCSAPIPTVFIGGQLIGSTNEVMSLHLNGSLLPLLKPYQAIS